MLFAALFSVLFNATVGAAAAVALGAPPITGAVGANVLASIGSFTGFAPAGILRAAVLREIWTGEMIKAFRTDPESLGWMQRIRAYNQYVENDVIHFTELGGDPAVLVNNTTYPLNITALSDTDKPISLDKFDPEATPVTDDELHACSYDKMASVQERHREALREKIAQRGIHALAPGENADGAPVLKTTGEANGSFKRMTFNDLLALKQAFDRMGIPKKDRVLVMCSDHINDLLAVDQKFREQYNINQTDGKISRLYGFDIYEYDGTPNFTSAGKKKAWGAAAATGDTRSSVAFYAGRVMKAYGSTKFYYSEAAKDTLYHRNLVNFRQWGILLPLSATKCCAAIISDAAPAES